jgi:hypothetical protein
MRVHAICRMSATSPLVRQGSGELAEPVQDRRGADNLEAGLALVRVKALPLTASRRRCLSVNEMRFRVSGHNGIGDDLEQG